ncbi:MAG: acyloxyacyl hydrolase [Flavobacteriaceae bacterium]|nr:acyloxyacyl hydrolase [Flavobacteriaceae bacterium]
MYSQNDSISNYNRFITAELLLGKTLEPNPGHPETKLHKGISLLFGNTNTDNKDEWVYRLKYPETGINFILTDFGNPEYLGYSFSVIPFIEYDLFKRFLKNLSMQVGMGASYFTYKYKDLPYAYNDYPENNSRAISTKATWAFKTLINYTIITNKNANWTMGLGILHQSNGHTRMPNNGNNSILLSVSRQAFYKENKQFVTDKDFIQKEFTKSSHYFFDLRMGLGVNVISEPINERKPVYTIAPSFGKIINKTFKIGIGFYYRFYQNYYDYIINEGELVLEDNPHFIEKPFLYSTNFSAFITSELLLGHIGTEVTIGYNIYKPFYETDWRLNKGFYWNFEYPDGSSEQKYVYGKKEKYDKLKKVISLRFGLRYYLFTNEKSPKNNFYIAANINTNLGQADFTELNLGYVHNFGFKQK